MSIGQLFSDSREQSLIDLQAWIDVGGTFTDCYVTDAQQRRVGRYSSIKILSSGLVPISLVSGIAVDGDQDPTLRTATIKDETVGLRGTASTLRVRAPELHRDPDDFWRGARLRMFDAAQSRIGEAEIVGYRQADCTLELSQPIDPRAVAAELDAGLEAPVLAVRRLLGCPLHRSLPRISVRLGTTRGTNALLTRNGARVALAITHSLEDLMLIGDQTRPRLFDLAIQRDDPLFATVVPIVERMDADGMVLQSLDEIDARSALAAALEAGCDSLAICLMHGYRNPDHELRLESIAREVGFRHISRSSGLAPLIEIVARARTTIVDAYLSPIIRSYLSLLARQFGSYVPERTDGDLQDQTGRHVQLQIMTSAGGLVDWQHMAGKDSILSGPAGGVVALRALAGATGRPHLIGLDMGGTSTDACRTAPDQTLQYESTKAGVRILTPTLPVETVASGGGSICWFDGVSLRVGPQSAGASPGPACYGRGGPLTITDLNVLLGRIPKSQFPFPLDVESAQRRLDQLWKQVESVGMRFESWEQLADGLRTIANEQMAEAVRTITIAEGADPRTHALVGFGGAAGQHICEIAKLLDIPRVIDTPDAGLMSALGMGLASQRLDSALPVYQLLDSIDFSRLALSAQESAEQLQLQLKLDRDQADAQDPTARSETLVSSSAALELRYAGTDASLTISWLTTLPSVRSELHSLSTASTEVIEELRQRFHAEHQKRFGYARHGRAIECVSARVEVIRHSGAKLPQVAWSAIEDSQVVDSLPKTRLYIRGTWHDAAMCSRSLLERGKLLLGPAIVLSAGSTLIVAPAWQARASDNGTLLIEPIAVTSNAADDSNAALHNEQASHTVPRTDDTDSRLKMTDVPGKSDSDGNARQIDAVAEAVFAQRLAAIATQMGVVLQQTALSVNVKQRRDFSCAVFDDQGRMLASAPHVPVHLGAMGTTVRAAMRMYPDLASGEYVITNDPYSGGSHLPDVTVISGIYAAGDNRPKLFLANRAHHADIGGMAPGSMCVTANRLGDEGVIITPIRLTSDECDELQPLRRLFENSQWPPRNIEENLADLRAQLAANARGGELIHELASAFTWPAVALLTRSVLAMAEQKVRTFIRTLPAEPRSFRDRMDDGTAIEVTILPNQDRMVIDFSGTGPTSSANFNANPSIVSAAIIYVLRCLIADDLPLNEGMLSAVDLRIPEGILNPRVAVVIEDSPAVAAGNVETSQRVVDVLLGALGAAAASQGTMNNLLFGNSRFGFYETICGGAGATAGHPGASGVHTHMTNTRLTDPEVLEARYPARLVKFQLRRDSGGAGRWPGGDGVIRAIQFLEPVSVSLLTSRRGDYQPYGLAGGSPGLSGRNYHINVQGQRVELPSACFMHCQAGETIELHTPGGGGFGDIAE